MNYYLVTAIFRVGLKIIYRVSQDIICHSVYCNVNKIFSHAILLLIYQYYNRNKDYDIYISNLFCLSVSAMQSTRLMIATIFETFSNLTKENCKQKIDERTISFNNKNLQNTFFNVKLSRSPLSF